MACLNRRVVPTPRYLKISETVIKDTHTGQRFKLMVKSVPAPRVSGKKEQKRKSGLKSWQNEEQRKAILRFYSHKNLFTEENLHKQTALMIAEFNQNGFSEREAELAKLVCEIQEGLEFKGGSEKNKPYIEMFTDGVILSLYVTAAIYVAFILWQILN